MTEDLSLQQLSPSLEVRENRQFASEVKFLVPAERSAGILEWARQRLSPDPYAGGEQGDTYRTTSLYLDTKDFDVLSKTGSFGRSKYRIRRYGDARAVFLERKLKTHDLVNKRRSVIAIEDLSRLRDTGPERGWAGHWFHRRIHARLLRPVCQISYLRTARVGMSKLGAIRMTLDRDIRALPVTRLDFDGSRKGILLSGRHIVLELKFRYALPPLFQELIETFDLPAQPVSKYRLASAAQGCVAGWVERRQPAPDQQGVEAAA